MLLPAKTGKPLSLLLFLPVLSALVLSGCGGAHSAITYTPAPRSTASMTISPSTVMPGQSATVTWSSANATSCSGSGAWSGALATSGSTTVILQGAASQTYILLCSGAGLPGQTSVTLSVPSDAGCTTAQAVRSHRARFTPAIAAARRAVANGTAGGPRKSH